MPTAHAPAAPGGGTSGATAAGLATTASRGAGAEELIGQHSAGAPRQREVDSDGFTTVRRGRACTARDVEGSGDRRAGEQAATDCMEADAEADGIGGAVDGEAQADVGLEEDGGTAAPATHQDLWEAWQDEKAALRKLRQSGFADGHWAVVEAAARADDAEEAWRAAKPQTAFSNRFRGAERAVSRTKARKEKVEKDIAELEATFNHRRQELQEQLEAAREKLQEAEARHEALRAELGASGSSAAHNAQADRNVIRSAAHCLECEVGPALSAVAELLDGGDPAEAKLRVQQVLSQLFTVHGELRSSDVQRSARGPRQYNLGDDDGDEGEWDESDDDWENPNVAPRVAAAGCAAGRSAADGTGPRRCQAPWPRVQDLVQGLEAGTTRPAAAAVTATARWSRSAHVPEERANKQRRTDSDLMDEQSYDEMAVPPHLAPAPRVDEATQQEIRGAYIREFCAAAEARGVDISDVDLANINQEQLEQLAAERLA